MDENILREMITEAGADMPVPSAGLTKNILLRIEREERRRLLLKTVAFGAVLVGSLSLAAYGGMAVAADASRSGLFAFTSLFFSDFSMAVASFPDLILSVAESFPIFSAVVFLSGLFFAVWSAARFVGDLVLMRERVFSRWSAAGNNY